MSSSPSREKVALASGHYARWVRAAAASGALPLIDRIDPHNARRPLKRLRTPSDCSPSLLGSDAIRRRIAATRYRTGWPKRALARFRTSEAEREGGVQELSNHLTHVGARHFEVRAGFRRRSPRSKAATSCLRSLVDTGNVYTVPRSKTNGCEDVALMRSVRSLDLVSGEAGSRTAMTLGKSLVQLLPPTSAACGLQSTHVGAPPTNSLRTFVLISGASPLERERVIRTGWRLHPRGVADLQRLQHNPPHSDSPRFNTPQAGLRTRRSPISTPPTRTFLTLAVRGSTFQTPEQAAPPHPGERFEIGLGG